MTDDTGCVVNDPSFLFYRNAVLVYYFNIP